MMDYVQFKQDKKNFNTINVIDKNYDKYSMFHICIYNFISVLYILFHNIFE